VIALGSFWFIFAGHLNISITMKKDVYIILLILMCLATFACKKEAPTVEGRWNIDLVTTYRDEVIINEERDRGWIEFNDDGNGEYEDGRTFEWTHRGGYLTIYEGSRSRRYEVASLKKNKLVLDISYVILERNIRERWELSK